MTSSRYRTTSSSEARIASRSDGDVALAAVVRESRDEPRAVAVIDREQVLSSSHHRIRRPRTCVLLVEEIQYGPQPNFGPYDRCTSRSLSQWKVVGLLFSFGQLIAHHISYRAPRDRGGLDPDPRRPLYPRLCLGAT